MVVIYFKQTFPPETFEVTQTVTQLKPPAKWHKTAELTKVPIFCFLPILLKTLPRPLPVGAGLFRPLQFEKKF